MLKNSIQIYSLTPNLTPISKKQHIIKFNKTKERPDIRSVHRLWKLANKQSQTEFKNDSESSKLNGLKSMSASNV